jgi:AraC-like DNA-binding protein
VSRDPTTTLSRASATGWRELVRGATHPRLAGLVSGRYGYRELARETVRRRMPASSTVPLALSFGDRLEVLDGTGAGSAGSYGSFVAGFGAGPADTRFAGTQHGVQVDLTPLGAYQILGVPASGLAHQVLDLADLAPHLARTLPDRLASLPTWQARFTLVDAVLAGLADRGREPDPLVRWLWDRLQGSGGQVRIADLVERSGWSHRHVTTRFREQVGVTPKRAAGVLRFERAAADLSSGSASLAAVTARHGYADQSHLTREFARLAGITPSGYAAGPGCRTDA